MELSGTAMELSGTIVVFVVFSGVRSAVAACFGWAFLDRFRFTRGTIVVFVVLRGLLAAAAR